MIEVFQLIDDQISLQRKMIAFCIISSFKKGQSINFHELNERTRNLAANKSKKSKDFNFQMFNPNFTRKDMEFVLSKLIKNRVIIKDVGREIYKLADEINNVGEIKYEKLGL